MKISVLGPIRVETGGEQVRVGGRKQLTLLALLAVHHGTPVSPDRCIHAIWGHSPPDGAAHSLQTYVSNLRRLLREEEPSSLETTEHGYVLDLDGVDADWIEFRRLVDESHREQDPQRRLELVERAIATWRGRPLGELGDQDWARTFVAEMVGHRQRAVLTRADALLDLGRPHDAIEAVESELDEYPYDEALRQRHLTALYRAGRQADALRAYDRFRTRLVEELGVDPGPELQALELQILQHDRRLTPRKGNLPNPLSSFVGRERELVELPAQLDDARLLTLSGYAGAGKTRTAIELARRVADRFPDGIWLIELAQLSNEEGITTEVFGALRTDAPVNEDRLEFLARLVSGWSALFIFDNCEHVAAGAARVVRRLLEAAPDLRVVATSRRPLALSGESVWPLRGLEVPSPDEPSERITHTAAVRLFLERAASVRPAFEPDPPDLEAIAVLCARLDGLPFGIELAAARTASMAVAEIVGHLDDRFSLLTGTDPTEVPHHRTLLETVEWSYGLLDPDTQRLYRLLSVFRGGFVLEAVEAVAGEHEIGDPVHHAQELVAQSLVTRANESPTRYLMLETVREHGLRLLDETDETAAAYTTLLNWLRRIAAGANVRQGEARVSLMWQVMREMANMRAALDWSVDHAPQDGLHLLTHMALIWWLEDSTPEAADSRTTSRLDDGARWATALLDHTNRFDPVLVARAEMAIGGMIFTRLGRNEDAGPLLRHAVSVFERLGDERREAWARTYLAVNEWRTAPIDSIVAHARRAADIARAWEDPRRGFILFQCGFALTFAGRYVEAIDVFSEAKTIAQEGGDSTMQAHAHEGLALAGILAGSDDDVPSELLDALDLLSHVRIASCAAHAIGTYGVWRASLGDLEEGVFAEGIAAGIREVLPVVTQGHEDRHLFIERFDVRRLDPDVYRDAYGRGRSLGLDGIEVVHDRIRRIMSDRRSGSDERHSPDPMSA